MWVSNRVLLAVWIAAIAITPSLVAAEPSPDQLLAEGRADAAIANLQSKLNGASSDAASYNLLCRAYLMASNWDAGITACQKAVSLEPGNSQYHLWLGRIYGGKADRVNFISAASLAGKVRTEFETAVRLDPKNMEAHSDLAEFYLEAPGIVGGGKDKAENEAQQMSAADPAGACLLRAKLAEKRDDFTEAEKQYRAAIQTSGGKAGTWLSLAQFYQRRGQYAQVDDAIQHVISADRNNHVLLSTADFLIHNKRSLPEAAKLLRTYLAHGTVEEAPAYKAHYLLGTLLEKDGDKAAAIEEYRTALTLVSSYSAAQTALNRLEPSSH
jgi:tetratricopeptide (TPR) repeat protein